MDEPTPSKTAWTAAAILDRPGILTHDTDADLNRDAFLGHSIDMQGFRAAEFAARATSETDGLRATARDRKYCAP